MAKTFDVINASNQILTEKAIKLPLPSQSTTTPDTRAKAGLAVQKFIVGPELVESMNAGAPADQQHFQQFLAANCFGEHYTRNGIDVPTRELLPYIGYPRTLNGLRMVNEGTTH